MLIADGIGWRTPAKGSSKADSIGEIRDTALSTALGRTTGGKEVFWEEKRATFLQGRFETAGLTHKFWNKDIAMAGIPVASWRTEIDRLPPQKGISPAFGAA